jgi:hypothetical protein
MFGDEAPEGKFLVLRRDGSQPEWPYFVIGAKDPAAPAALTAYAEAAELSGMDPQYVRDVRQLALKFKAHRKLHGDGDPDAPPHREDDPKTIEMMKKGRGA